MRIGVSVTSAYNTSPRQGAQRMIERARAAWEAELDSLFVGDHHVTPVPYYQNTPILGRLLAEWGGRPAGALYMLPLFDPLLLAEQIGTLASIAQGRFILQCGIGGADQNAALGAPPRQRPSRFEQSLSIMRRLWAGEEVAGEGRFEFPSTRISPVPPQPVEVWIAAEGDPAIDRAARLGDGWLASPGLEPETAREKLALYSERCEAHGRPLGVAAIRRDIYVGESEDEARATGGAVVERGYRGFPPGATIVGSVEQVTDALRELAALGYTDVIMRNLVSDQARALGSLERLGKVREQVAAL